MLRSVVRISRQARSDRILQVLRAFDESVSSSSIPQQTAGEGQQINKEQLPGPGVFVEDS